MQLKAILHHLHAQTLGIAYHFGNAWAAHSVQEMVYDATQGSGEHAGERGTRDLPFRGSTVTGPQRRTVQAARSPTFARKLRPLDLDIDGRLRRFAGRNWPNTKSNTVPGPPPACLECLTSGQSSSVLRCVSSPLLPASAGPRAELRAA